LVKRSCVGRLSIAPFLSDNPIVASCDKCGAPLRLDRNSGLLVCDHCGSQKEAPASIEHLELLGDTSSLCPVCATPLSHSRLEGHPLLCCARCYGMLIAMNRFATVIDALRAHEPRAFRIALPARQRPGDRVIHCPSCGQPMLCHFYAGPGNVVIDTCERCCVNWLDPGELRRIAVAPYSPYSPRLDPPSD
jgi:Zn-finger nucleic acid-binding protein